MKHLIIASISLSLLAFQVPALAQESGKTINVAFSKGASSKKVTGVIKGGYIDYAIKACAGQTLSVTLKGSNRQNYINVLPPGSKGEAMFIGSTSGNTFKRVLPDDGTYKVRVYLMRPAERRGESSKFTLAISMDGKPFKGISASADTKVLGTRFHASATVPCTIDAKPEMKDCEAFVVRRGIDGTATVELHMAGMKRRILFVKGKPTASDSAEKMTVTKDGDMSVVKFGDSETFTIPDALIFGG